MKSSEWGQNLSQWHNFVSSKLFHSTYQSRQTFSAVGSCFQFLIMKSTYWPEDELTLAFKIAKSSDFKRDTQNFTMQRSKMMEACIYSKVRGTGCFFPAVPHHLYHDGEWWAIFNQPFLQMWKIGWLLIDNHLLLHTREKLKEQWIYNKERCC